MATKPEKGDTKRKKSDLQVALEGFTHLSRDLTAENLEDIPGVLEALFEDDASVDSKLRHQRADAVRKAIDRFVENCELSTDRSAGKAAFAIGKDLRKRDVAERVRLVNLAPRTYYDHRDRLMPRLVRDLRSEFGSSEPAESAVLLSSRTRRTARQLYRYAQQALIYIEAFELCRKYSARVETIFAKARGAQVDLMDIPHGWLGKYLNDGGRVRLVSCSRIFESDRSIWAFAYFHKYLRSLLRDHTGNDYLREALSASCWDDVHLTGVLLPAEVDKLLSVLEEHQIEKAADFVDHLCGDAEGRSIHEHWQVHLSAGIPTLPASSEVVLLLRLCASLQHVFPDETISVPGDDFEQAVAAIIAQGAEEMGATIYTSGPDDTRDLNELTDAILDYSPPRYFSSENRELSGRGGEGDGGDVWSEKPSVPDVLDDFG